MRGLVNLGTLFGKDNVTEVKAKATGQTVSQVKAGENAEKKRLNRLRWEADLVSRCAEIVAWIRANPTACAFCDELRNLVKCYGLDLVEGSANIINK